VRDISNRPSGHSRRSAAAHYLGRAALRHYAEVMLWSARNRFMK